MTTYWPNKQSIDLNLAVSNIFTQTHQKICFNIQNITKNYIASDVFDEDTKKHLALDLLAELEILIIDIVELNLTIQEIRQLNDQILLHLINTTGRRMLQFLKMQEINFCINFRSRYNRLFFYEHACGANILLTYLIFGSESVKNIYFPFSSHKTPFHHVKVLFENMILQISNTIAFNLLESSNSIIKTYSLIGNKSTQYCDNQSIRKLLNFKNNLTIRSLINFYIYYPQNIYCGKYSVYLLSSKGIALRHIYFNRLHDYIKLSNYQLGSITYLEIKDIVGPRFNQLMALIGKLVINLFLKIIEKNINAGLKYAAKRLNIKRH